MPSRYIIRLDDACHTMDRERWRMLEYVLDEQGIRPIVSVVPDNNDPFLKVDEFDPGFWNVVRSWEQKGWTIALHGYQHVFHPVDRKQLLLPFYDRSEFAGLSLSEQAAKIRASWRIFQQQGIQPRAWIAPAHCFDQLTLEALRQETPIRIVSDGIALGHFYEDGFTWVPQQLWALVPRRSGLWTVCLHPNSMNESEIHAFGQRLCTTYYRERVVSLDDVVLTQRRKGLADRCYSHVFWHRTNLLNGLIRIRNRVRGVAR